MLKGLKQTDAVLQFAGLVLAAAALAVTSWSVRAEGVSVQMKTGMSSLHVNAGATSSSTSAASTSTSSSGYSKDGGIGLEIRPQLNLESTSLNAALGFFYQGHLGSDIGSYPVSRIGVALYYYPLGLALATHALENDITISQNHIAPFITGQATFATVSISDEKFNPAAPLSFNGQALGYMLGGGVEFPMSQTISVVGELLLEGTLVGGTSDNTGQSTTSGLSFTTMGALVGISIHP